MTLKEYPHEVLAAQPIGAWSGEVYRRVVGALREQLAVEGLTQPHWWTLNHAASAPGTWNRTTLVERLACYEDLGLDFGEVFDDLAARGWLLEDQATGGMSLTEEGEAARLRARERNLRVHRRSHEGVDEADFVTTINVLRRIAANMGGNGDLPG
ncbi:MULTISPECIES: MarR family transcriptional regulator [Kitasatospora]|uniref:MarR family transcriptional regulator n=1 Tax=Kitasatospora cathayae TaxID=3004092 RepID=A0ABY7QEN4_9ACTN|nr:MarR family transcriptional regulator [Kitasatospora sp. HUAS 3-15]WBP91001.1 MarR family transcriptional regulator [Kitasatospora sp. HUAS 3-15]